MKEKTILVAEDDNFNYLLIKYILEKSGFNTIHAANGMEVLNIYNSNTTIDLIVMDVKMPVMSGLEATVEIRKNDKKIPIIALTAYALPGDREMCLDAGCSDYISKPLDRAAFVESVERFLSSVE